METNRYSDRIKLEKKLELMQQVRSRYNRDQSDLAQRERILYDVPRKEPETVPEQDVLPFPSLAMRFLFAVGLGTLLILCDLSGRPFFGISTEQCFQAISEDYESSITQWVNAASHPNGSLTP